MTLREKVENLQKRFQKLGVFDITGKNYTKPYVKNLEGYCCNLEDEIAELKAEIIRLKSNDCEKCTHKEDGLYSMICFECKAYYGLRYEAKK